ncbi:MAG: DNA-processing protein DprA [Clostridiales bacterium]|nr:DNA-processing protein DprA [Clostridiales bacterium]
MDRKLAADLFCSLLMANHIMTGKQIRKLVEEESIPSLEDFWNEHKEYLTPERLNDEQNETWNRFQQSPAYLRFEEYVAYVEDRNIYSVNILEDRYPKYMKPLTNMPLILYCKGDFSLLDEAKPRVCIVGTRRPSAYGRRVTSEFSRKLAMHQIVIVSGLARGVDSYAHEACLAAGGKTIAVMPCGLDKVYPKENREIFDRIAAEGLLISELVPGQDPVRKYFPARNRILAAISDCVMISEAGKHSGTLHTASFAAAQGKEVFAVPSIIYSVTAEGNLALLKDGAEVVTEPEDILAFLAHVVFFREIGEIRDSYCQKQLQKRIEEDPENLSPEEIRWIIYDILADSEKSADEITNESGLPYSMVAAELSKMELDGQISQEEQKFALTIRV